MKSETKYESDKVSYKNKDLKCLLSLHTLLVRLRKALVQSEEKERALVRCQLELQKSINFKASCLYIDEVVCGQHREALKTCQF